MAKLLVEAAHGGIAILDSCLNMMSELNFDQSTRVGVSIVLLRSSIDQTRSACLLLANDPVGSMFAANILLRSQLDQFLRGCFFAGPASHDEFQHFWDKDQMPKREGRRLGPLKLSVINTSYFHWVPQDRIPNIVKNSWSILSGFSHGGKSLLAFYMHEDGIYPAAPEGSYIDTITNAIGLALVAVTVAAGLASNAEEGALKEKIHHWGTNAVNYMRTWIPYWSEMDEE